MELTLGDLSALRARASQPAATTTASAGKPPKPEGQQCLTAGRARAAHWPQPPAKAAKEQEKLEAMRREDEEIAQRETRLRLEALEAATQALLASTPEARACQQAEAKSRMLRTRAAQVALNAQLRQQRQAQEASAHAQLLASGARFVQEQVAAVAVAREAARAVAAQQKQQLTTFIDSRRAELRAEHDEEVSTVEQLSAELAEARLAEVRGRKEQRARNEATMHSNALLAEEQKRLLAREEAQRDARLAAYATERDRLQAEREAATLARQQAAAAKADSIAKRVSTHFESVMQAESRRVEAALEEAACVAEKQAQQRQAQDSDMRSSIAADRERVRAAKSAAAAAAKRAEAEDCEWERQEAESHTAEERAAAVARRGRSVALKQEYRAEMSAKARRVRETAEEQRLHAQRAGELRTGEKGGVEPLIAADSV